MKIPSCDITIRKAILAALTPKNGCPHSCSDHGNKGVIELNGSVADQLERAKLTALAENVSGVAKVIDQMMTIVEPALSTRTKSRPEDDLALAALLTQ
jgi:hypothetical protein